MYVFFMVSKVRGFVNVFVVFVCIQMLFRFNERRKKNKRDEKKI